VVQTRPLQGLSTDVLDSGLWWKSPPLPQNTSSEVGTLKQRSISVWFFVSFRNTSDRSGLVFGSLSGAFLAMTCSQHDTFAFRHEPFVEEGETEKVFWERYSRTGALLSCVLQTHLSIPLQTHLSIPTEPPPVKGSPNPSSQVRQYWYRPPPHPPPTSPLLPLLGVRRGRAAAALVFLFTPGSKGMCS